VQASLRARIRAIGRWGVSLLLVLCAIGLLVATVIQETRAYPLAQHGVDASAVVTAVRGDVRHRSYRLAWTTGSDRHEAWVARLSGRPAVGSRLNVTFDPADDDNVRVDFHRRPWWLPDTSALIGLVPALFGAAFVFRWLQPAKATASVPKIQRTAR
jgi:hypothetical protein